LEDIALTPRGREFLDGKGWGTGGFIRVPIGPRQVLRETRVVGQLSDVSRPGHYRIGASLVDPASGLPVRSNEIEVEVLDPAVRAMDAAEFRASFMVTIRPFASEHDPFIQGRPAIERVVTNISNRAIPFGAPTGIDEVRVHDPRGRSMSGMGLARQTPREYSVNHLGSPLSSGDSIRTVTEVGGPFDLTGDYQVQIGQIADLAWKPAANKGDPPMVWSNVVTVRVGK
jgi:hypothetical protein